MKKVFAAFVLGLTLVSSGYGATQPRSIGVVTASTSTFTGGVGLWALPVAQITALTATATGQIVFCTDCGSSGGKGTICVSTGSTNIAQFVLSTGTKCQ